ncbi:MAG: 6-phosphogluconolactonase [Frankiaceae bacterium]|nr:6-phosphogluconolactonase [Frankiaceae bacterium]
MASPADGQAPIEVQVAPDESVLAEVAAARLVTSLLDAQARYGSASVVLAGGGVANKMLAAVAASPARHALDWSRVDVWWSDERFVSADDDERNEKQAREALLDHVPVDPARIHPMPALDGPDGHDIDAAAARYADTLAAAAPDGEVVPRLDVLLLGMGPEGHTASMFPRSSAVGEQQRMVIGVAECPKPPPLRISLTRPAIAAAEQVWLIAAGDAKAEAVASAASGADPHDLPVASARGRLRTLWLLDQAAASRLH